MAAKEIVVKFDQRISMVKCSISYKGRKVPFAEAFGADQNAAKHNALRVGNISYYGDGIAMIHTPGKGRSKSEQVAVLGL